MDVWLLLVLLIPTLRLLWFLFKALAAGRWPTIGLSVALLAFVGVWYSVATTAYEIDDTHLIVGFGLLKSRVPLRTIHTLRATTGILSAPALSIQRLEVGSSYRTLQISPKDRAGFVAAIREHVPTVRVEGEI
jgi:hypothetical protein